MLFVTHLSPRNINRQAYFVEIIWLTSGSIVNSQNPIPHSSGARNNTERSLSAAALTTPFSVGQKCQIQTSLCIVLIPSNSLVFEDKYLNYK